MGLAGSLRHGCLSSLAAISFCTLAVEPSSAWGLLPADSHVACSLTSQLVPTAAVSVLPPPDDKLPQIDSKQFQIDYRINPGGAELSAVELWYTRDKGQTWHCYGLAPDRKGPVTFIAPGEGLIGFFIIAYSKTGASSERPAANTAPQQWAFVDYTPPLVQLRQARLEQTASGERQVRLSWTVYDANLPSRPVGLYWKSKGKKLWRTIRTHVANCGRYDWRIPSGLSGEISIRLLVVDRGGNVVEGLFPQILVPKTPQATERGASASADATLTGPTTQPTKRTAAMPTPMQACSAGSLCQRGSWYVLRGDYELAAEQFREALKLNPSSTAARERLAEALCRQGEYSSAINTYEQLLELSPGHTAAMKGLGLAYLAQRQYPKAKEVLEQALAADGNDAQMWLDLGDAAMMAGDRDRAMNSWRKAATIDPKAAEVITRAKQRLSCPTKPPK